MNGEDGNVHLVRIRRRARVVSWGMAPLALLGVCAWFLFNLTICMGGQASPSTLKLCDKANLLPDLLWLLVLLSLVWLAMALRDFGIVTGGTEAVGKTRIKREAINTRNGIRQLETKHYKQVRFALEMSAWTTAISSGALVFYWFELAFPLGLIIIAAILVISVRTIRQLLFANQSR